MWYGFLSLGVGLAVASLLWYGLAKTKIVRNWLLLAQKDAAANNMLILTLISMFLLGGAAGVVFWFWCSSFAKSSAG